MAGWDKKIRKSVGGDLIADEELRAGVFVQPFGTTGNLMAKELGGLVGRALAGSKGRKDQSETGMASTLPDGRLVLGLTDHRLVVWGHSSLTGKPKGFKTSFPVADLAAVEIEKLRTVCAFVLHFADGSSKLFEAPRMANDPEGFAALIGANA